MGEYLTFQDLDKNYSKLDMLEKILGEEYMKMIFFDCDYSEEEKKIL